MTRAMTILSLQTYRQDDGDTQAAARRRLALPTSVILHATGVAALAIVPVLLSDSLPQPSDGLRAFFIEPIAAPPKLAHKRALDPIHIRLNDLFWAIRQVAWKYPPDRRVLASFEVGRAMGDGRFEIAAGDPDVLFVLEVPPQLPRRTLIAPGQFVWVIMGGARFDRALRRLVLVAQDVEARYF